jgi:Mrp family chromosome partitioning ATPase
MAEALELKAWTRARTGKGGVGKSTVAANLAVALEQTGAVIADAGYGSHENYDFLDKNNIEAFVKLITYERKE